MFEALRFPSQISTQPSQQESTHRQNTNECLWLGSNKILCPRQAASWICSANHSLQTLAWIYIDSEFNFLVLLMYRHYHIVFLYLMMLWKMYIALSIILLWVESCFLKETLELCLFKNHFKFHDVYLEFFI